MLSIRCCTVASIVSIALSIDDSVVSGDVVTASTGLNGSAWRSEASMNNVGFEDALDVRRVDGRALFERAR